MGRTNLSNNIIGGILPKEFTTDNQVRFFVLANNNLRGPLPDVSSTFVNLEHIDLANNLLTGTLHDTIWKLEELSVLDLAGNAFHGSIPASIGYLRNLRILRLTSNSLSQSIPATLGKLQVVSEILDLSFNALTGLIPTELGTLQGHVFLGGNLYLTNPAPLDLCLLDKFDSRGDVSLCPPERNALSEFYSGAKGQEWTESWNWMDQYMSHCKWFGVGCNEMQETTQLRLRSNGLSGTLSDSIAELKSLLVLDLSDNDIKGSIPYAIGDLRRLTYLRLSYNAFAGKMPSRFQELSQLALIQLNSNRLTGEIPYLSNTPLFEDESSFVSDCGVPSSFMDNPLVCEECTMCCNSMGDCFPQVESDIEKAGFKSYFQFSWVLILIIIGMCIALHLLTFFREEYNKRGQSSYLDSAPQVIDIEKENSYALDIIGRDSIYRFFLSNDPLGLSLAVAAVAAQLWMCYLFIIGSEYDFSGRRDTDLTYTWMCPRDNEPCWDDNDVTWEGWAAYGVLMVVHLLTDGKLISLASF